MRERLIDLLILSLLFSFITRRCRTRANGPGVDSGYWAPFLIQRALQQCEERVVVGGNGQVFRALVVISADLDVCGNERLVRGVDGRAIGAEADAAVAVRDVCCGRHDDLEHLARG